MILSQTMRTRVQCDACSKAWVFIDGDLDKGLRAAGWAAEGAHACPPCKRAISVGRARRADRHTITSYVEAQ